MDLLQPTRNRLFRTPEPEMLPDAVSHFLGRDFPPLFTDARAVWSPAVNLRETETEFVLSAELPGMTVDDIEVEVQDHVLTITGEKSTERTEEKKGRYHLEERSHGRFERSFTLPRKVDSDAIAADFRDGVLMVHLPKRERSSGRRVEIRKT
jgi:HSP20 family protein